MQQTASKPQSAANSISSMKSLYIRCARFGSNSEEWISTHTDGCFCAKIVRQFSVRHQMEPEKLHGVASPRKWLPASMPRRCASQSTRYARDAAFCAAADRSRRRATPTTASGPVALHPDPAAGRLLCPSARDPGRLAGRRRDVLAGLPSPGVATEAPVPRLPDDRPHARRRRRHQFRLRRRGGPGATSEAVGNCSTGGCTMIWVVACGGS